MTIRSVSVAAFTFAAVSTLLTPATQAGVVISIGNATLTSGGSSQFVDVSASWVAGDFEGDSFPIDKFSFSFSILPVGLNNSVVSFKAYEETDTHGTPSLLDDTLFYHNGDHEQSLLNYVFHGNSYNLNNGLHTGVVSGTNNTDYKGGDKSNSGAPFVLTSIPTLLYRLEVFATGSVTTPELFNLAVTADSLGMSFLESPPLPYTVTGGEITVVAAAGNPTVVPEPSGLLIFATGVAALLFRRKQTTAPLT